MARRLEIADKAYLLENINSDFQNRSKQGKIHVLDSYCELTLRNEEFSLSSKVQTQINQELPEILLFSKIKNLEEYCNEYRKSSNLYASTINKFLHTSGWIKTINKTTLFDDFEDSKIGKIFIGIGGVILLAIGRKMGLIINTVFKDDPDMALGLIGLLIIGLVVLLISFISFNPYFFISARFISSKDELREKLTKQDDLIKYLPKKWFQKKEDVVFILVNHMKDREYAAYSNIVKNIPLKWFNDKDVVLLLLSMEHYSGNSYEQIINRLGKELRTDKNFFVKSVYQNWRVFECLPDNFKNDEDVIWSFLQCLSSSMWRSQIPESIFSKRENVMRLFEYEKDAWSKDKLYFDSSFLRGLPEKYKSDRELLKSILKLNGLNFKDIDPSLQNDAELIEIARLSRYPYHRNK
jgi:hypothetical protein